MNNKKTCRNGPQDGENLEREEFNKADEESYCKNLG
jgi:hypothetical protein